MSIKRTICLVLSIVIVTVSTLTMTVNANIKPPANTQWYGTSSVHFSLSKDSGTTYITTCIAGDSTVTKIEATTQLYIIGAHGALIKIGNSNYHCVDSFNLDVADKYYNLADGRYYATLSATVHCPSGTDNISTYDVN